MSRWRAGTLVAAVGVLLVVASCGGSDESGALFDTGGAGGADGEISIGGDVPDYVPSDLYLPDEMSVGGATRTGDKISLVGTFDDGDVESIQADMVAGMEAAGYELLGDGEGDVAAFAKNGVGRVRVRTSEFLDELTVTIDIDDWTDEQLDELRDLNAEEVSVPGRATAQIGDETFEAMGECLLKGPKRTFASDDASITLQIDETRDPTYVYADVTTPDNRIFYTENGLEFPYESSTDELSASGDMLDNAGGPDVEFTVEATCG